MKVRPTKKEDKEEFLKLVRLLYRAAPLTVKKWEKEYNRMYKSTFIAENKEGIIAYIASGIKVNSILVLDLYVKKKYREKGIATSLLKIAEKLQKNFKKKYLEVHVMKKDYPARKLYSKFGFKFCKPSGKRSLKLIK